MTNVVNLRDAADASNRKLLQNSAEERRLLRSAIEDDPIPILSNLLMRRIVLEKELKMAEDQLNKARDAFLNMVAEAKKWEVDEDADCDDSGRPIDLTTFTIITRRPQLEELADALGIRRKYDQCVGDAIDRAIEGR